MFAYDVNYVGTRLGVPDFKHKRFIVRRKSRLQAAQAAEKYEGHPVEILTIKFAGDYPC